MPIVRLVPRDGEQPRPEPRLVATEFLQAPDYLEPGLSRQVFGRRSGGDLEVTEERRVQFAPEHGVAGLVAELCGDEIPLEVGSPDTH